MDDRHQLTVKISMQAAKANAISSGSDIRKSEMSYLNQGEDKPLESSSDRNTLLGMLTNRRNSIRHVGEREEDGYLVVNGVRGAGEFKTSLKPLQEGSSSMRGVEFSPTHRYIEARNYNFVEPLEGGGLCAKEGKTMRRASKLRRQGSDLHLCQLTKRTKPMSFSFRHHQGIKTTCPIGRSESISRETKQVSEQSVIDVFQKWMKTSPDIAVAVAAIQALTHVVQHCKADTMMGLQVEVVAAANSLTEQNRASISLLAACNLFNRYVTQMWNELQDFEECKKMVIQRGQFFADKALNARNKIAKSTTKILLDETTVLTHSISRVVIECFKEAAERGKLFKVIVTETRPGGSGILTAEAIANLKIPVSVILDSAVASIMSKVDFVLVGAEGVVESGGIINKIGTYNIALIAKACNVPFYVTAESYKFTRMFPLTQEDIPVPADTPCWEPIVLFDYNQEEIDIMNRPRDYTPPQYIDLLFSDLGILTPSAVSDELIKLHR